MKPSEARGEAKSISALRERKVTITKERKKSNPAAEIVDRRKPEGGGRQVCATIGLTNRKEKREVVDEREKQI